jgi:homoserine/homoserine lactone efflux protein
VADAGVGSLLIASEVAFNIVKTIGALYMIYLGFSQWSSKVVVAPETAGQPAAHHGGNTIAAV